MRGLLVAAVGILLLMVALVLALRHMFQLQPVRTEAAILGTSPSCEPRKDSREDTAARNARCSDKK